MSNGPLEKDVQVSLLNRKKPRRQHLTYPITYSKDLASLYGLLVDLPGLKA